MDLLIIYVMTTLVKSENDGNWYYEKTQWKYILDYLCDCLDSFSEADLKCGVYQRIDELADDVKFIIDHEC